MLKLTFFQVFNTCVAAAAFLVDPTVRSHPRQWFTLGGALLANVTIQGSHTTHCALSTAMPL